MRTEAFARVVRGVVANEHDRNVERCSLCALELSEQHPHLLDRETSFPICVCRACSILFDRELSGQQRYRRIPERRVRAPTLDPSVLGVPVGLVFFVRQDDGKVSARYPSPAGATCFDIDESDWRAALVASELQEEPVPEVEALLLATIKGHSEAWIVPLSDCYRLVGAIRQSWKGLSGGDGVWSAVDAMLEELRRSDGSYSGR